VLLAQVLVAAAIAWLAVRALAPEWRRVGDAWNLVHLRVAVIAASGAIVLVNYAMLIGVWRHVVQAWGGHLSVWVATRIWFVSNLGKYVPGKVWQLLTMGAMAQQAGVPPGAAVGSSLFIAVVNVLAGVAVVLFSAAEVMPIPRTAAFGLGAVAVGVVLAPRALPAVVRWAAARAGKSIQLPPPPYAVIVLTFAGCALGWVLHGIAFHVLALGSLPEASGATRYYVALFTSSYLIGYLTPWAPGGAGVRELTIVAQMEQYGLTSNAGALVLALISRAWLTVLELLPGITLLLIAPKNPTSATNDA
jgi:hypothetical protein